MDDITPDSDAGYAGNDAENDEFDNFNAEVNIAPKDLQRKAINLTNFLWRRDLPIEGERRRALYRKFKMKENSDDDLEEQFNRYEKKEIKRMIEAEVANWRPMSYSAENAPYYLVGKLAPNFAVNCRVLYEIRKRCSDFKPSTLFDFGSGLGTVVWAANSVWPSGSIREHFLVDTSPVMVRMAEQLLRDGRFSDQSPSCFPGVHVRQFLPASPEPKYDLVVSSGSLLDVGMSASRKTVLRTLWEKTNKFLVLVEAGTTGGFQAILEARDFILETYGPDAVDDPDSAAQIFAPCPHHLQCPKAASICNFNVKYKQLNLIATSEKHLNEVFSFVIFCKGRVPANDGDKASLSRIVSYKPRKTPKFVVHDVCNAEGSINRVVFAKKTSDKFLYAMVSKGSAGDRIPGELLSAEEIGDISGDTISSRTHEE